MNPATPSLVSVALATFNGERYLSEMLDSLESQTYGNIEIVVSDDGSSDTTTRLLQERNWRIPTHMLLTGKRLGVIGNFERAIRASSGEYVAFADQDDWWMLDKISAMASLMQALESRHGKDTPILVFTDIEVVDARLGLIASSFFKSTGKSTRCGRLADFFIANHIPGCSMLVNRALIDKALPVPANFRMHDWWFVMVAAAFGVIDYLDRPLLKYRQHGSNTFGVRPHRKPLIQRLGKLFSGPAWRKFFVPPADRIKWIKRNIELFEARYRTTLPPAASTDLMLLRSCSRSWINCLKLLAAARTGESTLLSLFTLRLVANYSIDERRV